MRNRNPLRAATVAATVAAVLSMAAPSIAAAKPHPPAKPKPAKVQRFTASGLVVASTPKTLRVIARQMRVGATSLPENTVVTVKRPVSRGKAKGNNLVGYAVTLTGTATKEGRATTLTASQEKVAPRPAEVFVGEVTDVRPGRLTLEASTALGRDDFGDEERTLTVDISTALSTVDGERGRPEEGEFAVVLGEREEDTVVAATVDGLTEAPDVLAGEITDVSGSVVTLDGVPQGDEEPGDGDEPSDGEEPGSSRAAEDEPGNETPGDQPGNETPGNETPGDQTPGDQPGDETPGDDNPGDGEPGEESTTVDLAPDGESVPVILNGGAVVDPEELAAGEHLLVLGQSGEDGDFTPTVAFAFDEDNRFPAARHRRR